MAADPIGPAPLASHAGGQLGSRQISHDK